MFFYTHKGITLIEMAIYVAILGLIAVIALPMYSPSNKYQREAIAQQFADAIRYARLQAISTGEPYGFRFLSNQERIRVFRADTATTPATMVFDVYHPIDKQLYDYTLPSEAWDGSNPVSHNYLYRGNCISIAIIYFDANGTAWCNDPNDVSLDYFELQINVGEKQSIVRLDGITGGVSIR